MNKKLHTTGKFKTLLAWILLVINLNAFSQEIANSILWKVTGNRLEKPSYIFGTIHILDSSYFDMPEIVKSKFSACDKLVTEVDIDDPDFQTKTLIAAMMKNDSIDNLLTNEEFQKVDSFFTHQLKMPLSALKRIKPFYLAEMPVLLLIPEGSKSYEKEFQEMATSQNKDITGISTLEKEAKTIDGISFEVQVQMLLESVENYETDYERMEKVLSYYRDHDIDAIFNTMYEATSKYDGLYEALFIKRHETWIPQMDSLMHEHSCFFAVGVGHLAGEEGLIALLRKRGYRVTPEFIK